MKGDATQTDRGAAGKPRRRGSETRVKGRVYGLRLAHEEYQQLDELATREGMTIASYLRDRTLTNPIRRPTRAIRRPVVEVKLLAAMLGQLHKVGSNMNQIARRVNMGETPLSAEITAALAACRQLAERIKNTMDGNT